EGLSNQDWIGSPFAPSGRRDLGMRGKDLSVNQVIMVIVTARITAARITAARITAATLIRNIIREKGLSRFPLPMRKKWLLNRDCP
ncbi:MAG: hypothetical protein MUF72_01520, partial [Elainella sp. Prado103]|nr:hypothetical protein [Elainella sp. Prado103]